MSDLQGFAFDGEKRLDLPFDFVEVCNGAFCDAGEILTLMRFFSELGQRPAIGRADLGFLNAELLDSLIGKGLILSYQVETRGPALLLPATPKGRSALEQLKKGSLEVKALLQDEKALPERPNLYQLYEDNIGPLTPMLSELLKEDAKAFPNEWFEPAIREAVKHNVRNWNYVRAILKNWKENGREKKYGRNDETLKKFQELYRKQEEGRRKPGN